MLRNVTYVVSELVMLYTYMMAVCAVKLYAMALWVISYSYTVHRVVFAVSCYNKHIKCIKGDDRIVP